MGSQLGALFGGLFGDAGQNFVDLQGGKEAVFGRKPDVAPFTPIDLSAETGKAVSGNLANYDSITQLLDKIIPGFSDILKQGSSNTLSELQGQLPQDVIDQIQRSSAFQSLVGGYSGTPMSGALTARDLGLSSLNLTQTGTNAAQQWSSIAESAYSPFTVSTGQQAGTTAANNAGIQANQQFKFNVAAAPDPGAAGVFNLDAALGEQMLSLGGALGGAALGGSGSPTPPPGGSTAGAAGIAAGNNSLLYGGGGTSAAYQYNPSTGQFQQVPQATGAWQASDRRLKENIVPIGITPGGIKFYLFSYLGQLTRWIGVMADEVRFATVEEDGYLKVDYSMLDVEFRKAA